MPIIPALLMPQRLYKFRSVETEQERERVEDILLNNRLWASSPKDFNDPFDCAPTYSMTDDLDVKRELVQREIGSLDISTSDRDKLMKSAIAQDSSAIARTMMLQHQEWLSEWGVLSLSASVTNVLLWSHYANSHRGICLEFKDFFNERSQLGRTLQVRYQADRPVIEMSEPFSQKTLQALFLTKADSWEYEKEWRFLRQKGPGYVAFNSLELDAVVLGALATQETEAWITGLVQRRRKPTKIKRATLNSKTFDLIVQ